MEVYAEHKKPKTWPCPEWGAACKLHDHDEERIWRHVDSCHFQTLLHARIEETGSLAMSDSAEDFIKVPVPPGGTAEFKAWKARGADLPPDSPRVFLTALKDGSEPEQYAALLGLRFFFDYEAFGHGYGNEFFYEVRAPGEAVSRIISPTVTPKPESEL